MKIKLHPFPQELAQQNNEILPLPNPLPSRERESEGKFNSLKDKNRFFNFSRIFKGVLALFSFFVVLILVAIFLEMIRSSSLSLKTFGFQFITGKIWDPVQNIFGALPFIYGTLVSSLIAIVIAIPVGLGVSLFLTEWAPSAIRTPIAFLVELLAAIPSVIYGLWGIFFLVPFIRETLFPILNKTLGPIPYLGALFQGPHYGVSLFAGGVILSIMILPTMIAISRELFLTIPNELREGVLALGGTRFEIIKLVVLRLSFSGIMGAVILSLGRALGETMAVTMVIGNRPDINFSLFAPGYSLASVIANEFSEATSPLYLSALAEMGLILLMITFIVSGIGRVLIYRARNVS